MRRFVVALTLLLTVSLVMSCGQDRVLNPGPGTGSATDDAEAAAVALQIARGFDWEIQEDLGMTSDGACVATSFQREVITGDIVHYSFRVRTGPGVFDEIGVHRVVREDRPNRPIQARNSIFLQHGDAKNFTGMFLPGTLSPTTPNDFGIAVFLAQNDVDVWGIDQAWTLLPAGTPPDGSMAGWGLDRQVDDLDFAIRIARYSRRADGSGYRKMFLLGYSSGSATGYALVNAETQLPPGHRQIMGYIPADYGPVSDDPDWTALNCSDLATWQELMDNGVYLYDIAFSLIGNLARTDPGGPSPLIPGFTNLQAAYFFGIAPIFGVGAVHYLAGVWDGDLPAGLQFVTDDLWLDFLETSPPYEATAFMRDYLLWGCLEADVPWDDHFAEIEIPILNVASAGGIGPYTLYALTLLGSSDITNLWIQLYPEEQALLDFAHIDIFIANNAQDLVWEPILAWIDAHTPPRNGDDGKGGFDISSS